MNETEILVLIFSTLRKISETYMKRIFGEGCSLQALCTPLLCLSGAARTCISYVHVHAPCFCFALSRAAPTCMPYMCMYMYMRLF